MQNEPATVRIPFINEATKNWKIRVGPINPQNGARHSYWLEVIEADGISAFQHVLKFQEGAVKEVGVNGLFSVPLLVALIDHLKSLNSGEYATGEAACAITNLEQALHWLCARADERAARGVLGQHAK